MVNRTLNSHIDEAMRLKAEIDALTEVYEAHKAKIKTELKQRETEEYRHGKTTVKCIEITSKKFDTTRFKKDNPEIAEKYMKETKSTRLTMTA